MTNVHTFFSNIQDTSDMFGCTSLRKNDKKVGGQVVAKRGDEIRSVYRFGIPATKKDAETRLPPGARAHSDAKHAVLTVFDMCKRDKDGIRGAFRRINLDGIVEIRHNKNKYFPVWDESNQEWDIVQDS